MGLVSPETKEKEHPGIESSVVERSSDSSHNGEVPGAPLTMDEEYGVAPDGGLKAWLVAAGGASVFFCCLGFANSFGTFSQYYATHQLPHKTPDDIAWIGSLNSYLQMAMGLFGGPAFDRWGAKVVRIAAILYIIMMMVLSLCKEYWHFMLVQAVIMGTLQGFMQIPAFAAVSHYFDKKRAAALGFGRTVRVIGFLVLPPRQTRLWRPGALRDARFLLVVAAFFFASVGMFTPLFYLPTYAVARGVEATMAGYLLAVLNAASTFGRVIPGVLADRYGRVNALATGCLGTGLIVFCFSSAARTEAALVAYAVFVGFFSGSITSAGSAAISICCPDPRDMGAYMGMGLAIGSLGLLIGPPIGGALVRTYGGYFEFSMFGGAVCTFGGFVALSFKLLTPEGLLGKV